MRSVTLPLRHWASASLLVLSASGLFPLEAKAGLHRIWVQPVASTYVQPAAAPLVYSAPVATTYQTSVTYPTASTYSLAPAAPVSYAPAATTAYAPAAPVSYAPAATTAYAPAAAPAAGSRLKAVDRDDIIGELRKEAKDSGSDGTTRERRKALRDSATSKYADAIGVDDSDLNDTELQDIDVVVNSILGGNGYGLAPAAYPGYAPAVGGYAPAYAPSYAPAYAPAYAAPQPATIVQPVVPVQLLVPVQPKHHWFK